MRKYLISACSICLISVLIFPIFASPPSPCWSFAYRTEDNGTLAHKMSNALVELGDEPSCLWRPFDPNISQLFIGDLWVCITGGINKAVFDSPNIMWIPFGQWTGLLSWLNHYWPPEVPIMSDHDTYTETTDQGYIGLEVYRHFLMWDGAADADYFIFIYTIKNMGSSTLNNLYISRYCDFNLVQPGSLASENICGTDFATLTVWMKQRQTNCNGWVGIRRLNGNMSTANHFGPGSDPKNEQDVINLMVNGNWFGQSGAADWRIIATVGPFSLAPGTSQDFTFAHAFGFTYADMMSNLDRAKERYDGSAVKVEPLTLGRIKGLYR